MRKFKQQILTAVGFVILVAVFAFAQTSPSHAGLGQTTTVDNSANNPVPVTVQGTAAVTGSVSITNLPAVQISGTPSVALSGTPAVTVSGTTPITNTDEPGRNAFQTQLNLTLFDGVQGGTTPEFAPPPGKALVVELTSLALGLPLGQLGYIEFTVLAPDRTLLVNHIFPLTHVGAFPDAFNNQYDQFVGSYPARMYVPAGGRAYVSAIRNSSNGRAGGGVSISGYSVTP